ncbi:hypothetical protein BC831DRAFT_463786 [Entophlyctis helioformis]|nr:hypothetical protein BC831DRAFT_463786 [Entophlyctis helioformis]
MLTSIDLYLNGIADCESDVAPSSTNPAPPSDKPASLPTTGTSGKGIAATLLYAFVKAFFKFEQPTGGAACDAAVAAAVANSSEPENANATTHDTLELDEKRAQEPEPDEETNTTTNTTTKPKPDSATVVRDIAPKLTLESNVAVSVFDAVSEREMASAAIPPSAEPTMLPCSLSPSRASIEHIDTHMVLPVRNGMATPSDAPSPASTAVSICPSAADAAMAVSRRVQTVCKWLAFGRVLDSVCADSAERVSALSRWPLLDCSQDCPVPLCRHCQAFGCCP